jgi:hypothetical protein
MINDTNIWTTYDHALWTTYDTSSKENHEKNTIQTRFGQKIQDDNVGKIKDGANKNRLGNIHNGFLKTNSPIPDIHQVALPYTTWFAASDPSHPSSAVTHGGRPAWRWSIDAVAYTRRKPAAAGYVCFCLLFGCWLLLKFLFSLYSIVVLSFPRWVPTPPQRMAARPSTPPLAWVSKWATPLNAGRCSTLRRPLACRQFTPSTSMGCRSTAVAPHSAPQHEGGAACRPLQHTALTPACVEFTPNARRSCGSTT